MQNLARGLKMTKYENFEFIEKQRKLFEADTP